MMIKKTYILLFIMLFLVSTTGLPLSLHICAMQNSASFSSCDMCAVPDEPKSCCSEDETNDKPYLTSSDKSCCETTLVDRSVKENFISLKGNNKDQSPVQHSFISGSLHTINEVSVSTAYYGNAPPVKSQVSIFLLNSSFLI